MANDARWETLKFLRENVNWELEDERRGFLRQLYLLIKDWKVLHPKTLPHRAILRREEIDWLLIEDVKNVDDPDPALDGGSLVEFFVASGYEDEPDCDAGDPQPSLLRTTAVHWAARRDCSSVMPQLFRIYRRLDANYIDEDGYTHFHAACEYACNDVVERFLQLGRVDPNCLVRETGDSPLRLTLRFCNLRLFKSLLLAGADPNSTDVDGATVLHVIFCVPCLFDVCDEVNNNRVPVRVDARDKSGRTPLQIVVARLMLDEVDVLLNRGADLASFVFPSESQFDKCIEQYEFGEDEVKLGLASYLLEVVERLEKRGYELGLNDALTIVKLFAKYGLFEKSRELEKCWRDNKTFVVEVKKIMKSANASLDHLMRWLPEESVKIISRADYHVLTRMIMVKEEVPEGFRDACRACLCEKMWRGFLRRWGLALFLELTCHQLLIHSCENLVVRLRNEDLLRLFVAAEIVETGLRVYCY